MKKPKLILHPNETKESKPSFVHVVVPPKPPEDPDTMFPCQVKIQDFYNRMRIPRKVNGKEVSVYGHLAVLKRKSDKVVVEVKPFHNFRSKKFDQSKKLSNIMESEAWKETKALETFPVDFFDTGIIGADFTTSQVPNMAGPNNEFIVLLNGPFYKQLYIYDYLLAHALCFESKNHNPLSKTIVDIISHFAMGKGVKITFKNQEVQSIWDKHEKRTKAQERWRIDCDSLTWAGETMSWKQLDEDGEPRIKQIDPSTVWEIVTDPTDIDKVYYYHQQYGTQYQNTYKPGDVSYEYVVNDIPGNEIIHAKINVVPGEKRGRADIFNILGWLKTFKDYYMAAIIKEQALAAYFMKVKIKGSQSDVTAYATDPNVQQMPPPGSKIIENESVDTELIGKSGSSGGSAATDNIGEAIRSICATGVGLSPEYLGVGGKASTRATALTKSEPSTKKFEDRQLFMERKIISPEIDWVLKVKGEDLPEVQTRPASLSGIKKALKKRDWKALIKEATALLTGGQMEEPADLSYEVTWPDISTEDRSDKLKDIYSMMAFKSLSHETASNMASKEMSITNYDYDVEQEVIAQEMENKIISLAMNTFPQGITSSSKSGSNGAAPGSMASDKNYKDQEPRA